MHVRAPGVVALQNVHEPTRYLVIKPEELTYGRGNSKSNLKVDVKDDNGRLTVNIILYMGKHGKVTANVCMYTSHGKTVDCNITSLI